MDRPEIPAEVPEQPTQAASIRLPRPASVTILVIGVLIITAINLVRLVLSIQEWKFLATWPGVSPFYIALSGLIWTLAGSILLWGLWRAERWAPRLARALVLTYALYYWLDHVFLVDHPLDGASGATRALLPVNWPFSAGITVLCLAYTAWTLNRRNVKAYFGQDDVQTDRASSSNEDSGSFQV